ncbi:unnamed protein product [Rhodiola kirilowii]
MVFSIAAINDTDSQSQWEPLAPTKEAQEFHLSQTYHDGLVKLQAKEYKKAQELLEAVLKDPLILRSQADSNDSDGHLSQLRFLALKNLATVFLEQGCDHYESALHCYLQAVEIDTKDSVVWNKLGTLACSMGLLSISRWAFEQGLICSPNNWNCMEKLLEVLIAIGDEMACLSVADLILRRWPSHSRALHVKRTIEDSEPVPFAPRGIDKLEPKHVRLKFIDKRKSTTDSLDEEVSTKRLCQVLELQLEEATWPALSDILLDALLFRNGFGSERLTSTSSKRGDIRLCIDFHSCAEKANVSTKSKDAPIMETGEELLLENGTSNNMTISKEKDSVSQDEQPHERRSSRLERLRTRKPDKEQSDLPSGKDLSEVVCYLEPYIIGGCRLENTSNYPPTAFAADGTPGSEYSCVIEFIKQTSTNYGALHMGHMLLDEVASRGLLWREEVVKFLELEQLTRQWGEERTPHCSLFLAELYHDLGISCNDMSKFSECMSEVSYHLCKIIESVASSANGFSSHVINSQGEEKCLKNSINGELFQGYSLSNSEVPFWVRFYWLSGQLSIFDGDKGKALEELFKSLSLLAKLEMEGVAKSVLVTHCKIFSELTVDMILHQINLLHVDSLLKGTTGSLIEKEMYAECVNLLAPLLLSSKSLNLPVRVAGKEDEGVAFDELSALDVLIQSCEKAHPLNLEIYLNSHCRKLHILGEAAGMQLCLAFYRASADHGEPRFLHSEKDLKENTNEHQMHLVTEEVKAISQCVSLMKQFVDQCGDSRSIVVPVNSIADVQSSLLAVMCNVADILSKKPTLATADEPEHEQVCCFVDAAAAFFKLQHLHSSVPIKSQVDLIVAVHDLLAEYGVCCASGYKGEEGLFLKLAIKHLLVLDMKLKSSSVTSNTDTSRCDIKLSPRNLNGYHNEANMEIMKMMDNCGGDETNTMEVDELHKSTAPEVPSLDLSKVRDGTEVEKGSGVDTNENPDAGEQTADAVQKHVDVLSEDEREELETAIDNALNQCFFCLYGLNLRSDSIYEDDLAMHRNTTRGDYQSKEQCADVFKYILPYAKASSKTGLIKLRRVLRAIRKHFPEPPEDLLNKNAIDKFLDDPSMSEDKLSEEAGSDGFLETMLKVIFPDSGSTQVVKTSSMGRSEPYLDVYCNLYYLLAQSEDMSATDKWPGFVLTKEGEEFVEQNAKLYKYDLLFNPLHFESWQRLAHIYDEEVDLLLNDGSKHINVTGWRKNTTLSQRVETSRRRSRRCLLMSLALAQKSAEQREIHELLALVYYDSLQNVVPSYDQRSVIPVKDAMWRNYCENSLKHFKKASAHEQDWTHAFYMGKLSEKLGLSHEISFSYYSEAIALNPSAVDPFYRMHASRLKLLAQCGKQNMGSLKVVAEYCCNRETRDNVLNLFGKINTQTSQVPLDMNVEVTESNFEDSKCEDSRLLEEAWHILYRDCLSALEWCIEGDLKHFHKARYMLAEGLYLRGESGDLEKAKEELSFCFKSSRSSFTINMWEIDASVKKGRRKTIGCPGNKRVLEVNLPESSRKFITCIRKYMLFYLRLLEETKDIPTLDRAFVSLRADKRFALSLEDLVPVALGRYVKALIPSIRHVVANDLTNLSSSENLLEKLFNLFMEQVALWPDMCNLPEFKSPEWSENNIFQYLHQYIHSLEVNMKLETLETIVEKIRRRFKNPKLSNSNCAKVCRHASAALCRSLIISLALVTPGHPEVSTEVHETKPSDGAIENSQVLWVDLRTEELWSSSFENPTDLKDLETKWTPMLSSIRNIRVKKVSDENMQTVNMLLRSAFNFFRDTSSVMLTSGVKLYSIPSRFAMDMQMKPEIDRIEIRDLSIQRKILLWTYTLLHGQFTSIASIIKYCEENIKMKVKKGSGTPSAPSNSNTTPPTALTAAGGSSETECQAKAAPTESTTTSAPPHSAQDNNSEQNALPHSDEIQKSFLTSALQLHHCINNSSRDSKTGFADMNSLLIPSSSAIRLGTTALFRLISSTAASSNGINSASALWNQSPSRRGTSIKNFCARSAPDVRRLAETARITLTPAEVEEVGPKIQQVLDWFGQLQAVDLENVQPAIRADTEGDNLRDDIPEVFENRDEIIASFPSYEEPFIIVPKVLNKE